jgi:hypothetical protein
VAISVADTVPEEVVPRTVCLDYRGRLRTTNGKYVSRASLTPEQSEALPFAHGRMMAALRNRPYHVEASSLRYFISPSGSIARATPQVSFHHPAREGLEGLEQYLQMQSSPSSPWQIGTMTSVDVDDV